jgi:hypothetical protein
VNLLLTNGGTIRNDGVVEGPVTLGGTYETASTGQLVRTVTGAPNVVQTALPRLALLDAEDFAPTVPALGDGAAIAAATKAPPEGPFIVTGDADFTNTTVVVQFANGFAPQQGDTFPLFQVQGQLTGTPANVEIRGLAPGATFDLSTTPGTAMALTDTVALPVVSMKAPAKLKESAKSGAKVTFKRAGSTVAPLTVHYVLGGTAENGIDYATVPEEIEIPAKKKSATLAVKPAADGIPEPPETITVELLPGDDYQPALPSKATITLLSTEKRVKIK